jgi:hypothetical protein
MTSDQQFGKHKGGLMGPQDLAQIREALSDLRALRSHSALADLAEEKIRALESGFPGRVPGFRPPRKPRNLS